MRYEIYETKARFSYRAVLITLTSHLVVIDFRQGRLSTTEQLLLHIALFNPQNSLQLIVLK
jgi:hypothetical protein